MVLVTSKAVIRTEELIAGTLNCSGANRATNAGLIHHTVWEAARAKGVHEPEAIGGQEWTPAIECRNRLEPYGELLSKIIKQWSLFGTLVTETYHLTCLLEKETEDSDHHLVTELKTLLKQYGNKNDFSIAEVTVILRGTGAIHKQAKAGNESATKTNIRNLLHGKIEQFPVF